jgi:hypothetical protein
MVREAASSAALTTGVPVPTVPTLTRGRAVALVAWTTPATTTPSRTPTQGCCCIQVELSAWEAAVVAAKMTPPTVGRTRVWMASLTWSTTATLSRTSSATSRTETTARAQPLWIQR